MANLPYAPHLNLEAAYLLGNFGVQVSGRFARLTAPVTELAFGDWTGQGLPFYGGNVTYHATLDTDEGTALQLLHCPNPLLTVALDGATPVPVAFAPYRVNWERDQRPHHIDITVFGNRVNTFGTLHNADRRTTWYGPAAWRTEGAAWADEYQLRPQGLTVAPMVQRQD